jgi:multiple sugar transport system ATP-binding protein
MARVELRGVGKTYPGGVMAAEDVNLDVADGEFMVLVGPSGCGKSTALRMIAGLEAITDGTVAIGGKRVNELPPKDRDVAMVFQNYALYPHMTVRENIEFGLKIRKVSPGERDALVKEAAAVLGIEKLLERRPKELSGGQRQRVALGRAIVRKPSVFLFDEPLSNLDAKLRVQMRAEIKKLQNRLGVTTVYVTHDQVEAMTMGSRIAVMKDGYLQQVGTPIDVYDRPMNIFVAQFIGTPPMNFLDGRLVRDGGLKLALKDGAALPLPAGWEPPAAALGRDVVLGVRPEHLDLVAGGGFAAPVQVIEPLGNETLLYTEIGGAAVTVRGPGRVDAVVGGAVNLLPRAGHLHLFDAGSGVALGG